MAFVFPYPDPLNAYAALGNGTNEIQAATGYVREPITIALTEDGYTASNLATVEWPTAMSEWGPISSVLIFDAPTGGNLLFSLLLDGSGTPYSWGDYSAGAYSSTMPASLVVHMYDRPRISASGVTAAAEDGAAQVPNGFGLHGFGINAYGTDPVVTGTAAAVIKTFAVSYPCKAGTWSPGPWARAA